jgi:uncharacterized UBP type Zn finger protein
MMNEQLCSHLSAIEEVKTSEVHVCETCIKAGTQWLHLRICQTCGITLCCDDSPKKHMTAHYRETQHPVIASAEPKERWLWCYPDEAFVEY